VRNTLQYLHRLRDLAADAVEQLRCGDIDSLGPALRAGWETKRNLASGVSNESIDLAVGRALAAGASGAKITGAGGGGFVLAICPVERQQAVRESLSSMRELPIKFDSLGTRVVLNVARDIWT
jgi:D-glycero-alpha-D-manno-heptose-7-phosphate kinase